MFLIGFLEVNILDTTRGQGLPDILTTITGFQAVIDLVKTQCIVTGASHHLTAMRTALLGTYDMINVPGEKKSLAEMSALQKALETDAEQLRLRAVSLPDTDDRKKMWVSVADFTVFFWKAGFDGEGTPLDRLTYQTKQPIPHAATII